MPPKPKIPRSLAYTLVLLAAAGFLAGSPGAMLAKPLTLPLTIDYTLPRSLVVYAASSALGETAVVFEESSGWGSQPDMQTVATGQTTS